MVGKRRIGVKGMALHHCVDEVSEKGSKHVEHRSSVAKLIDSDTAEALVALRSKLEGKQ